MKKLEGVFLHLGAAILILMTLHTAADVASRNLLNKPILGTYETITYWYMVAVTAIGLWSAEVKNDHISVSLLTDRLPHNSRFLQLIVSRLITVAFLVLLAWYGFDAAIADTAIKTYTGASEIPIWPTKYFLPLGFVGFTLVLLGAVGKQLRTGEVSNQQHQSSEVN